MCQTCFLTVDPKTSVWRSNEIKKREWLEEKLWGWEFKKRWWEREWKEKREWTEKREWKKKKKKSEKKIESGKNERKTEK